MKRRTFLQGLSILPMMVHAFPGRAFASTPTKGGKLVIGQYHNNIKNLDPIFASATDETAVLHQIYESLVDIGPDFSIQPCLAKAWDVEQEGKRYVFHLLEGVKFHDGTEFNADAVKYNFDFRLNPESKSPYMTMLSDIIASVEVVDKNTVAFNLKEVAPSALARIAERGCLIVSPTSHQKLGQDFARSPVGTGPFKFREWVTGSHVVLEAFPDHHRAEQIYLDTIEFRIVPNTAIGVQRLNIGEIDVVENLVHNDIRLLDTRNGANSILMPVGRMYLMSWRVDQEPFQNKLLRQAIAHAVDYDRMNKIVFGGEALRARSFANPNTWYGYDAKIRYEYDLEKAKKLLAESGYDVAKPIVLWASSEPTYSRIVSLLAEHMQQLGLTVEMQAVSQSEYWAQMLQVKVTNGPLLWSQFADPDLLASRLLDSAGGWNTSGYKSAAMDDVLKRARLAPTKDERLREYGAMHELFMEDLPYLPLLFGATYTACSAKAKGYVPMPHHVPRLAYMWKTA